MSGAENLTQIIYASVASRQFEADELRRLVDAAESANVRTGITGVLITDRGSFLQLIEGPSDVVEELFERISVDFRHARVSLIARERVGVRSFPGRPLVALTMTPAEVTEATGVEPGGRRSEFQRMSVGAIRALLAAAGERRNAPREVVTV